MRETCDSPVRQCPCQGLCGGVRYTRTWPAASLLDGKSCRIKKRPDSQRAGALGSGSPRHAAHATADTAIPTSKSNPVMKSGLPAEADCLFSAAVFSEESESVASITCAS